MEGEFHFLGEERIQQETSGIAVFAYAPVFVRCAIAKPSLPKGTIYLRACGLVISENVHRRSVRQVHSGHFAHRSAVAG